MEDNLSLQNCSNHDVILARDTLFKVDKLKNVVKKLLSKDKLGETISNSLDSKEPLKDFALQARRDNGEWYSIYQKWFNEGINCEILKLGASSWQKGKIKINLQVSLEFCPDEPEIQQLESPLDDLRQILEKSHN